jgi:hypothetical protein
MKRVDCLQALDNSGAGSTPTLYVKDDMKMREDIKHFDQIVYHRDRSYELFSVLDHECTRTYIAYEGDLIVGYSSMVPTNGPTTYRLIPLYARSLSVACELIKIQCESVTCERIIMETPSTNDVIYDMLSKKAIVKVFTFCQSDVVKWDYDLSLVYSAFTFPTPLFDC